MAGDSGLLAKLVFQVGVDVDSKSVQDAISKVEQSFKSVSAPLQISAKIEPPDLSPTKRAFDGITKSIAAAASQIKGAIVAVNDASESLLKAQSRFARQQQLLRGAFIGGGIPGSPPRPPRLPQILQSYSGRPHLFYLLWLLAAGGGPALPSLSRLPELRQPQLPPSRFQALPSPAVQRALPAPPLQRRVTPQPAVLGILPVSPSLLRGLPTFGELLTPPSRYPSVRPLQPLPRPQLPPQRPEPPPSPSLRALPSLQYPLALLSQPQLLRLISPSVLRALLTRTILSIIESGVVEEIVARQLLFAPRRLALPSLLQALPSLPQKPGLPIPPSFRALPSVQYLSALPSPPQWPRLLPQPAVRALPAPAVPPIIETGIVGELVARQTQLTARYPAQPPSLRALPSPRMLALPAPQPLPEAQELLSQPVESVAEALTMAAATVSAAATTAASEIESAGQTVASAEADAAKSVSVASETMAAASSDAAKAVSTGAAEGAKAAAASLREMDVADISSILRELLSAEELGNIKPGADIIEYAASKIKDGTVEIGSALEGLRLGLQSPADVLAAVSNVAKVSATDLTGLKAAFEKLDAVQMSKIAGSLKTSSQAVIVAFNTAVSQMSATAKQAARFAPGIRQISSALRASLSAMGVTVRPDVLRMAAAYVQKGVLTFDEAEEALAAGTKNASQTISQLAGSISNATKIIAGAMKQLYGFGPPQGPPQPPSGGGAAPAAPEGPLPSPKQALQLASAMSTASSAAGGFMQILMSLRWELFTLMFFLLIAKQAFKQLANMVTSSAATIDRVSSAITILRASGVENVEALINELVRASGYFLTYEEAARKLSRVAILDFPPQLIQYLPYLMKISRAIALLSDEYGDAETVFDKVTDAIARAQMRMATTAGATSGTLEDALERFRGFASQAEGSSAVLDNLSDPLRGLTTELFNSGVAARKSVEELTPYQKSLLIFWTIAANAEDVMKVLPSTFDENTAKIQEMSYSFKELGKTIGIVISKALGISTAAKTLGVGFRQLFGELSTIIDRSFRPDVYEERMRRAEELAKEYLESMTEEELQFYRGRAEARLAYMSEGFGFGLAKARAQGKSYDELIREMIIEDLKTLAYANTVVFDQQSSAASEATSELKENIKALRGILGETENASDATDKLSESYSRLQSTMTQAASLYVEYRQELEDTDLAHRRWYEDLIKDYNRKLAELQEGSGKEQEQEQADRDKRRRDAAAELARRLADIERDLANRLREIWRSYYDEMFMAELDRDALSAFLAMRRRDREIEQAQESAQREREQAYERYQEQLREAEENYNKRIAEIEQKMKEERDKIEKWLLQEQEDREIYERRAEEDRARQYERRYAELMRSLAMEYELQRIANDQSLTEEQRYMLMMRTIFSAYNTSFISESKNTYAALTSGAQSYFEWLRNLFIQYYQSMITYRNSVLPLLSSPLTSWSPQSREGEYYVPGKTRRRATGGVDFVTSPTAFLAGERGPELVVTIPWSRVNTSLSHQFNATIMTAAGDMTGRINAAVMRTLESVVNQIS